MTELDRRRLLALGAAALTLPPAIAKAWAIDAKVKTGTINDVDHVVILMQENRSFDHYFGTMNGVRGFADRFPIPLPGGRTVWSQENTKGGPSIVAPFPLDTAKTFAHMRVEGTPHNWADAQYAWDNGRMTNWPDQKHPHAMGHYAEADIPFQFALANAFTVCEAYHCSFQGGTNTNRLFLWTGTNDPAGKLGGPSISNSHDTLPKAGADLPPYLWTTYPERLEAAGISWKIYEDMADNFGDNPLVGFKAFRDSYHELLGSDLTLADKGLSTQHLDELRADVMADRLPQVSWIISPAADSEHPGPSSPAQGADYTARVLDCLTANPDVWARTALLVMFDENDGFFDHVPPPAPPSRDASGNVLGGSTVDTTGEYHLASHPTEARSERDDLMGRPYGLGPRVPAYVISPWSRGGWVNAEVFDHTSVIRFLEKRFGVMEPNISAWRRAVCGDLTSCFDFKTPNAALTELPATAETARRAATFKARTTPPTPATPVAPVQNAGVRRSRALPYRLLVTDDCRSERLTLNFSNSGEAGAVLHAYDLLRLEAPPRRYTVAGAMPKQDQWPEGPYDVCVYGPNGYFRRFTGSGGQRHEVALGTTVAGKRDLMMFLIPTPGLPAETFTVEPMAYENKLKRWVAKLDPGARSREDRRFPGPPLSKGRNHRWSLVETGGWYDFRVRRSGDPKWSIRLAGRQDDAQPTTSDPAMGGAAVMNWI